MKPPITIFIRKIILSFLVVTYFGCGTPKINQTISKKREGKWIEKYNLDNNNYISIGRYKNDEPVGKWKYYINDSIIKIEKHRKLKTKIRFYHKNGKIESQGITKLDTTPKKLHWYYQGKWKYYLADGQLAITREYNNGILLTETKHQTKP